MMLQTISETCRCGARIEVPHTHNSELAKFRKHHEPCLGTKEPPKKPRPRVLEQR